MPGQAADTAAVQCIKTGQAADDVDAAQLVETPVSGAYPPQKELRKSMTRTG